MDSSLQDVLLIERKGAVAVLTLNRPSKCNALSVEMNVALSLACASIPTDVGLVVLRGNGKHFCAGSDLKDLYDVDRKEAARVLRIELEACLALARLPQPTVALMHGKCLGGGAILPLYCDLRIGRVGMEVSLPEVSLGWAPPYGLECLRANVSKSFALEMLLSGRACGDREVLEHGWIHRLMNSEDEEQAYLERLMAIPRQTLTDTLALTAPKDLEAICAADHLAMEAFLNHFDTDHARKQIASFFEKKRS